MLHKTGEKIHKDNRFQNPSTVKGDTLHLNARKCPASPYSQNLDLGESD